MRFIAAGAAAFAVIAGAVVGASQASAVAGTYTPITTLDGSAGWTGATGTGASVTISPLPDMARPNGSALPTTGAGTFGSASFYRNAAGFSSATTLAHANQLTYDTLTTSPVTARLNVPVLGIALDCDVAVSGDEMGANFDPFDNAVPGHDYSQWTRWNAADPAANWTTTRFISTTAGGGVSDGPAGAGLTAGPDVLTTYASLVDAFTTACPDGYLYFMDVRLSAGPVAQSSRVDHLSFLFSEAVPTATNAQDLDFSVTGTVAVAQTGSWGSVAQGSTSPDVTFTVTSPLDGPTVPDVRLDLLLAGLPLSGVAGCESVLAGAPSPMTLTADGPTETNALSSPITASLEPGTSVSVVVRCTFASTAPLGTYSVVPSVSADLGAPSLVLVATGAADPLTIAAPPATAAPSASAPAATPSGAPATAAVTPGALAATGPDGVRSAAATGALLLLVGLLLVGASLRTGRAGLHS